MEQIENKFVGIHLTLKDHIYVLSSGKGSPSHTAQKYKGMRQHGQHLEKNFNLLNWNQSSSTQICA